MKTLILILVIVTIVKPTPVTNQRSIDKFWIENFPEAVSRQKKSSEHETAGQNIEDFQVSLKTKPKEMTTQEKSWDGPIVIKKKPLSSSEEDKSVEKCKQVKFNLCDGENESNNKRTVPMGTADRLISEKRMEDSIKLAKEAMDNLQKDIHKIEQSAMKSQAETDTNLHTKIEVARQALDNIHQNIENFETNNDGSLKPKDEATKIKLDDEKREAMWKEMTDKVQKFGSMYKNTDETNNSDNKEHSKFSVKNTDEKHLEGGHHMRSMNTLALENDFTHKNKNEDFNFMELNENTMKNTLEEQENNLKKQTNSNLEKSKSSMPKNEAAMKAALNEKHDMNSEKLQRGEHEKKSDKLQFKELEENMNQKMSQHEEVTLQRANNIQPSKLNKGNVASSASEETKPVLETAHHQNEKINTEDKLLKDALRMHSSQTNKDNKMQLNPDVPKKTESENKETHATHGEHLIDQQLAGGIKTAELTQDSQKEEMEMGQSTNQNFEFGLVPHTFEDPQFMRLAHEKQDSHILMPLQSIATLQNEHLKSSMIDENVHQTDMNTHSRHLEGHEDSFESHMHDHIHTIAQMKSSDMDSSMQPSMVMHVKDPYGRSAMDYNAMQWNHPSIARTAYGSSGTSPSPPSSGGSGSGAVGVFPNANVGNCAIPLLLSCSPSLISGNLAKPHHPYPAPSPSYRTGEDMKYYIKRDIGANEEFPVLKVLRTNTPFNHKNELIIDRKLR